MASDYDDDDEPETPIVSRRIGKLSRRQNNNTNTDNNTITNTNTTLQSRSPPYRSKPLDISKILGKVKNSSNYSGYSANSSLNDYSSFNNNHNNNNNNNNSNSIYNNWRTESLFADEGDDDLSPALEIENELQRKKERHREKLKLKENEKVEKEEKLSQSKSTLKSKTKAKKTQRGINGLKLDKAKASKITTDTTQQTLTSPEKENIPNVTEPITPVPKKKRGRSKKVPESTVDGPMEKASIVKPTRKRKTKNVKETDQTKEASGTKAKNNKTTRKRKASSKHDTSSSFSLFEVLDINEQKDKSDGYNTEGDEGENSDDIFILDSPVKKSNKRRKTKKLTEPETEPQHEPESEHEVTTKSNNRRSKQKSTKGARDDSVLESYNEELKLEKKRVEEEEKLLKQKEQEAILVEMEKLKKEEKLKQKQERERQQQLKREVAANKKKEMKELQLQKRIQKQKKQKKLKLLEKLKESTSKVMNKNVETVIVPLKDEISKADNSNTNIKLRRSSLASRGRRLSAVGNGFMATPHDDIPADELHKHVDISLPDSHKLKQLLVWLSKRLIKQGWDGDLIADDEDDDVKSKSKMICKIILEEFVDDLIQGRADVDWWGSIKTNNRHTNSLNEPIIVHENKENVENANKLAFYDNELKKLQREKKIWQELKAKNTNTESDIFLKEIQSSRPIQISDNDYPAKEIKELEDTIRVSYERTDKLERLVHRLQVSNDLIQRIMERKNRLVAEQMKQQSQIDVLDLLKKVR